MDNYTLNLFASLPLMDLEGRDAPDDLEDEYNVTEDWVNRFFSWWSGLDLEDDNRWELLTNSGLLKE